MSINNSDNDDNNDSDLDEDAHKRNKEFESHRKAHYNEFKMAQMLRNQLHDDEDDEEEAERKKQQKNDSDDVEQMVV